MKARYLFVVLVSLVLAALLALSTFDRIEPQLSEVSVHPRALPPGGGSVTVTAAVSDNLPFPVKVTIASDNGIPRRTVLARGRLALQLTISGRSREQERCEVHRLLMHASDWNGNISKRAPLAIIIAGTKSHISRNLAERRLPEPVCFISVWDAVSGTLQREYIHPGWGCAGATPRLFLEHLKVVQVEGEKLEMLDLAGDGIRNTTPMSSSAPFYPIRISNDVSSVTGETARESTAVLSRVTLRAGNASREKHTNGPCRRFPSGSAPGTSSICMTDTGVVYDLDNLQPLLQARGYYGSDERDFAIKDFDLSADGSKIAFLFHYRGHPGPNWVQIWDLRRRSEKHAFTYSPCPGPTTYGWFLNEAVQVLDKKSFPFSPCPAARTPDESYASSLRLSSTGRWLQLDSMVLAGDSGRPIGNVIAGEGVAPAFEVRLARSDRTDSIVDAEMWAMTVGKIVNSAAFSHDGKLAVPSAGQPDAIEAVELFDIPGVRRLCRISFQPPYPRPGDVAFSPDGRHLHVLQSLEPAPPPAGQ